MQHRLWVPSNWVIKQNELFVYYVPASGVKLLRGHICKGKFRRGGLGRAEKIAVYSDSIVAVDSIDGVDVNIAKKIKAALGEQ